MGFLGVPSSEDLAKIVEAANQLDADVQKYGPVIDEALVQMKALNEKLASLPSREELEQFKSAVNRLLEMTGSKPAS